MESRIAAAVLIGGRSTRMGSPKEDMVIPDDGRTFLERICDEVDLCSDREIYARYLSVRKGQAKSREGWTTITDEYDDIGPLGGLTALLERAGEDGADALLLLACDMIKYNAHEISRICSAYKGQDILFARTGKRDVQPLASIYRVSVLEHAKVLAKEGIYRMRALADDTLNVGYFDSDNEEAYLNINTPVNRSD